MATSISTYFVKWIPAFIAITLIFLMAPAKPEQMISLAGNHPPDAARLTRAAPGNRILHIRIIFALRNREALDKFLSDVHQRGSARYLHWMTPAEFEARFGQRSAQIEKVKAWLSNEGMSVSHVDSHEIAASATVAQVEKTFSIPIATSEDGSIYANQKDPNIPARFAGVIGMIDGLDNLGRAVPMGIRAPLISSQQYFKPVDFQTFYNETPLLNSGINGTDPTLPRPSPGGLRSPCGIALPEDSDYLDAAVAQFNTTYSLPSALIDRVFTSSNHPGRNQDESEALLDIEWTHAVAPGANIRVYIGDLIDAITSAITDNRCTAISISYVLCGYSPSTYQNLDSLFARAATYGQSVFVASDDYGAAASVNRRK